MTQLEKLENRLTYLQKQHAYDGSTMIRPGTLARWIKPIESRAYDLLDYYGKRDYFNLHNRTCDLLDRIIETRQNAEALYKGDN